MTMYLVVSAFTSSPVCLLASTKASLFFFIFHPTQYIIISINQQLMYTI